MSAAGRRSDWLAGLVVGAAAGFAALEIPPVGWLLVLAFAVPVSIRGPRAAPLGGLLCGIGAIWLVLLGRVALSCRAAAGETGCQAPGIETWLLAAGAMLVAGLLASAVAWARSRRGAIQP